MRLKSLWLNVEIGGIEEAKKMLKDEGMINFTIATIAYECGFNTLSAFNVAFKKFTRVAPSQFRSIGK